MKTATRRCLLAVFAFCAQATAAQAGEQPIHLKDAPGRELVAANCILCHSLDYIPMNSPFLDEKGWQAAVSKMIKVMGAPITAADAEAIVRFLAQNYGALPENVSKKAP